MDREERPDVDRVYMAYLLSMTGQGGWPMTLFLFADGRPFFAGTYFADENRDNRIGFYQLLQAMHDHWTNKREMLSDIAVQQTGIVRGDVKFDYQVAEGEKKQTKGIVQNIRTVHQAQADAQVQYKLAFGLVDQKQGGCLV